MMMMMMMIIIIIIIIIIIECKNNCDTSNKRREWDHFKVI